jgi:membrane protease YdiL (CAAX protease family)
MTVLVLGLPVMAVAQLSLLDGAALEGQRIPAYASSAVAIAVLGLVAFLLGTWRFGIDGMGLGWPGLGPTVAWTLALLAATAVLLAGSRWVVGWTGVSESPILEALLPRTRREKTAFAALSFCAGTGEELAYRAYAISILVAWTGSPVLALLVASTPFAVVHVYQGRIGLVRTYLLGVALGVSFLASASLWPAMIAHTLIDLIGGLVIGDRFFRTDPGADRDGTEQRD